MTLVCHDSMHDLPTSISVGKDVPALHVPYPNVDDEKVAHIRILGQCNSNGNLRS